MTRQLLAPGRCAGRSLPLRPRPHCASPMACSRWAATCIGATAQRLCRQHLPVVQRGRANLWWSPDPRMVFRTEGVHLSSRFRRQLRGSTWEITADTFSRVMRACAAAPRPARRYVDQPGMDRGLWPAARPRLCPFLRGLGPADAGRRHLWGGDRIDVFRRKHVQWRQRGSRSRWPR